MKKILLACAGGFSTSMLVTAMLDAAKKKGIEVEIDAVAEADIENQMDVDILLLGPQIAHRLEELSEELSIPVLVIDSMDYGMMNGEKVLHDTLQKLN